MFKYTKVKRIPGYHDEPLRRRGKYQEGLRKLSSEKKGTKVRIACKSNSNVMATTLKKCCRNMKKLKKIRFMSRRKKLYAVVQ